MTRPTPRLAGFDPAIARRMAATVSCTDSDDIAKVDRAGETVEQDGRRVQIMHNGVVVEEGGYFGDWMTEIIRALRGHHEPQEELVFDRIVQRLAANSDSAVMIEFGSHWTYYGLWFAKALPGSRVVALEPDLNFIEVGRRNAAFNTFSDRVTFVHGAIGTSPGEPTAFRAESDGRVYDVPTYDLASLMTTAKLDRVDVIIADIQGAESILLDRARGDFEAKRVRFLLVSTHHHSISGDPLTHQNALRLLEEAGAHVITEHSVAESFSGDGLIAVSFDAIDKDFTVEVSHARSKDSLFGELEFDLAAAEAGRSRAERDAAGVRLQVDNLELELERITSERDALAAGLDGMTATRVWRWTRLPRAVYARIRGLLSSR